ncbi:MAG: sulfatase [Acidobacteria bacterium]|nr:sulfatase [Acidobacteriota bacterium]
MGSVSHLRRTRGLSRRQVLSLAVGAPVLLRASGRRTNVLFIVSDDLNNAAGCYGHPVVQTPHMDRLGRHGMVFDRAYCQYSLCQPSRASFLSGLRPETTRVWTLQTPTRQHVGDAVFLPELFRRNGYFTAHAGKIYHTGEECEDPRSWDEEVREWGKNPPPGEILESGTAAGPKGHSFEWDILKTDDARTPDGMVARKAVEWMEKLAREGRPFFLGAGFRRPHAPYAAPKKYFDLYPVEKMPLPRTSPEEFRRVLPAAVNHDPPDNPLSDDNTRRFLRAYFASVTFMDAQLGVLLDAMDRLGLWDNTIVVFSGDNGYHLGEHGGLWHKNSLFEESARIPLIVAAPGRKANGRHSARLVELVDLYPTLADLCGLRPPENLEGTSFAPLLDDPGRPWKSGAFTMQGRGKERTEAAREIDFIGKSVRTERWRYTEWDEGRRGVELYDHDRDPGELKNLADDPRYAKTRAQLSGLLRRGWRAALPPRT